MNPLPLTVSVKPVDPAVAVFGEMDASAGAGLLTLNVAAVELPPPGGGFITVTEAVPDAAKSVVVIAAVSCVDPTYVVARLLPFHCTCEAGTKPLPATVSDSAPDPTLANAGTIEAIAGAGLAVTVKVVPEDVPPPPPALAGFTTVTVSAPMLARSAAKIAAFNCVALT
jgi:hypothetical protein